MTTELLDAPMQSAVAAYQPFYAELAELEKSNTALAFNYETPKGNKEARSHVHKLRQTKGALERARKDAKAEYLRLGRAVDSEANEIETRIEAMIDVHQVKIDEIENREKARVAALQSRLGQFEIAHTMGSTVTDVQTKIELVQSIEVGPDWQEFMAEASMKKAAILERLNTMLLEYKKRDAEAVELERLRAENVAREQRERDADIATAAAEKVRREEAERAATAAAAAKKAIADVEAAAKAQADAAAKRESELKQAALEAERCRIVAEEQVKRDVEAAATLAEQDKQRAIQAEKDRFAAEAAAVAKELAAREADKTHRATINTAALAALVAGGINEEISKTVIKLIAQHKVPHVSIAY